ncbi:MAG TPA: di-trans,poly-cis-decaprenylcistransferase [Legionellales bacterium]|nr:di-trans,poly-cis-decaprenylcistransferase [Legionellales bacterium]
MKEKKLQHVAIVMDGNGRWATQKGLPRVEGHRQGLNVVREIIKASVEKGIHILSLFAFSHENWSRPQEEVNFLMELFITALQKEVPALVEQGIHLRFLGSQEGLSPHLILQMHDAEKQTAHLNSLNLNIALNYSGKWDILNAVQKCLESGLSAQELNASRFESFLSTQGLPEPDLMIRTSGETRISNFFLWQLAYTELFFTDVLWPDFNRDTFQEAIDFFENRERRFGKTSQQLRDEKNV